MSTAQQSESSSVQENLGVEEKVSSLFQPDILLPAQFYATSRRKNHLEPEKRLMLGILEDAIYCFQHYVLARNSKGKTLFRDAEEWILEGENNWLFSFENICEVLGLNANYIREGLMRWKEKELAKRPKARIYRLRPRAGRKMHVVLESRGRTYRCLKAVGG